MKKEIHPASFQKALLGWYDRNKRDLPWRKTQDPYAIFVSEMMLQQTQVKTVIPYYERFLKELPNWKALARADEQKVLKLWEGLGYYRRARNLKAAAQMVQKDFGGKLPDTLEEVLKLPGVGPYSAGAVLSIAYQKPLPLVDGNVIRVFSRVFLLRGDLKSGPGNKKVWDLARQVLPAKRPGVFNQALMELGATLCFSDHPQCLLCPLLDQCQAAIKGVQLELPESLKDPKTKDVPMAALLILKQGKVLVKKRSNEERWLKGLWEFPSSEGKDFEDARNKLEKALGVKAEKTAVQQVKHQITNHKIELRLYPALPPKRGLGASYRWVQAKALAELPFASAQNKLRGWFLRRP